MTRKLRSEDILDVATRLFAERGFEGASMSDVAERADMGKASLFYHFATKDALYEAVLDRVVASFQQPLEAIYATEGSITERLDALTDTLTGALGAQPYAARLLLRETMDWGPVMRGKLVNRLMLVLEAATAWVAAGQKDGVFVKGDPRHMVLTVLGMHLLPFGIERLVERFLGVSPFDPTFVKARSDELRRQARNLQLKR
jgi:TetR/AcrR family transcriptional regulator